MIEKQFINSTCISCGKETPVVFHITDTTNKPLYQIPLCRQCSNMFAEDVIGTLRVKYAKRGAVILQLTNLVTQLKAKVKQMNTISHGHKAHITKLREILKQNGLDDITILHRN